MEKIEVGPEARKLLMRLFMESYINCPEPLTGEEIEALCLLVGLQVLAAYSETPAFRAELTATMKVAARRTGAALQRATLEAAPESE